MMQIALGSGWSGSVAVRVRESRTAGSVLPKESSGFYLVCKNVMGGSAGNIVVVAFINTAPNASLTSDTSSAVCRGKLVQVSDGQRRYRGAMLLAFWFSLVCVSTYTHTLRNTVIILYS